VHPVRRRAPTCLSSGFAFLLVSIIVALPNAIAAPTPAASPPIIPPFHGTARVHASGGSLGCGFLRTPEKSFNLSTGYAHLEQASWSTQSPCSSGTLSTANGTLSLDVRLPIHLAAGFHQVRVKWYVVATLTLKVHSRIASLPSDECTVWSESSTLSRLGVSYGANGSKWSSGLSGGPGPCAQGNGTFVGTVSGTIVDVFNDSLSGGIWTLDTSIRLFTGTWVAQPGWAYVRLNMADHGNYARLVSVSVR
jgi:hypothetical protein